MKVCSKKSLHELDVPGSLEHLRQPNYNETNYFYCYILTELA